MGKDMEVDAAGLTLLERRVLQEIAIQGNWRRAAETLKIDPRRVRTMFKNPAFKEQYDNFFDADEVRVTERELNLSADDAAWVFEEAKNAELQKKIKVTCPDCGHKFDEFVKVADHATRLRAAETLLKMRGLLKDNRSVKVEGRVEHVHWDYHEQLILQKLDLKLPVPRMVFEQVEQKAKLAGMELPEPIFEGEYHVIENDTDTEQHDGRDSS
jgi:hypothetical protein